MKAPVVREVLRTAGLLNVWEVAESRDAAVQMLGLRADGRQKTSRVLPTVGVAALVAALAGAGLTIWRAGAVDARIVLAVQLACSAIALGSGLWTAIYCSGPRRGLGVGLVVASAVVSVAVVFHHPRSSSVRPSGRSEPRADKPARKPSEQGTASRKPPKNPN